MPEFHRVLLLLGFFIAMTMTISDCTLIGGRSDVNLSNPTDLEHMTQLALFGVKSIAEKRSRAQSNIGNTLEAKYSLMNITSAQKQLVAGMNYFLSIEMQPEECSSSSDNTDSSTSRQQAVDPLACELKREVCDLTIWEKVWENFTELTKFECQTRRVVSNLGARVRIDNDDSAARHALDFAITEMNKLYKQAVYYVPVVQNTYKQVVNGIKYTFEFEYAPTSCPVSEENMEEFRSFSDNAAECKVDTTKEAMSCVVTVLDQFWLEQNDEQTTSDVTKNGEKNYDVIDKPSRYTVTLKNCT